MKKLVPFFMNPIRLWDRVSADRIDRIVANSHFVAARIKKYYRKETVVIHPPVDVNRFAVSVVRQDYYLMVGRLIAYKRHDIAIEAFNRLQLPLRIIGRGPELERLKRLAGPTVQFLGRVDESELPKYYAECRGFVFPQEEDFGIVAIEALASGRPLIAYRGGDIPEHMQEGKMGVFFEEQTSEAIIGAVERFQKMTFNPQYIRSQVLRFDKELFKTKMKDYIEKEVARHLAKRAQAE